MLIDLSRYSPLTINPLEYPTTVAVRIDTDNRPECGVFAGKHLDFEEREENKLVPMIAADEIGSRTFILDRPERGTQVNRVRRWNYAAIGWDDAVYLSYPYVYSLTLEEHNGGPENYFWSIGIHGQASSVKVILTDYEPGALARGCCVRVDR